MPRVDWSAQAPWAQFYGARFPDGRVVSYGREWANGMEGWPQGADERAAKFVSLIPLTAVTRVLVVGCGLGFTIERLKARGIANTWGLDSSPYIETSKAQAANGVVWVNADVRGGGQVRTALRQLTGATTFDVVLSESVLESYDDAEIPALLNAAEAVLAPGGKVAHFVFVPPFTMPGAAGVFNEKTIDQWKAVRSTHLWISDSFEVR